MFSDFWKSAIKHIGAIMGLISYFLGSDGRKALKKLDKMARQVEELEPKYQAMSDKELRAQTDVLKGRLAAGETTDDILFDAFAAFREASWRVIGMKHFHVQIIGGICLHQGRIAEMRTGEGKTLVSTLPAYLNALTGKSVHIVTVNDYLVRRDAEWMGKVHKFMGLTVGVIVPGQTDDEKRAAYACDVVYATNNELGFDYLRDNLKTELSKMVQRDLSFAIVDEVDSILIDEARTPLIISGPGEKSSELYRSVDRFVRTLSGGFDDELKAEEEAAAKKPKNKDEAGKRKLAAAEAHDWDYVIERKEKSVQLTESGAKKAEAFFNLENIADIENAAMNHHIQQALKAHKIFKRDEDYIVKDNEIIIVDEFTGRLMIGRRYSDGLHQAIEAKEGVEVRNENKTVATITFQNYFRIYKKLSGMTGTAKTEEAEFRTIYSLDVVEIPTNRPIQRIDSPDRIYSTIDGKKRAIVREIVDRHEKGQPILIGTSSVDKSEEISRLLRRNGVKHNILNAKNHEREAEIVAQAGRFGAVTIATNMAGRGTDILLGGNPEYLAKKRLREEQVERELIEQATSYAELPPEAEAVRVRYQELYKQYKAQTDAEKEKVISVGGLCIIGTERHESRRIDNQLRGRSGRQGDPGYSVFFLSLEDDLVKRFGGDSMKRVYDMFKMDEDQCLESKMLSRGIENAQRGIEGRNFGIRKNVLQYDDVMNKQREIIYAERLKVLKGEDCHQQVLKYIPDFVETVVRRAVNVDDMPELWNADDLNTAIERSLIAEGSSFVTQEKLMRWDYETAIKKIAAETEKQYEQKIVSVREEFGVNFGDFERAVLLSTVDRNWMDHIDAMDQLRKGIGLRAYAQTDPVIAYKQEGFEMFDEMIERIQTSTIALLLKASVRARPVRRAPVIQKVSAQEAGIPVRPRRPLIQTVSAAEAGLSVVRKEQAQPEGGQEEGAPAAQAQPKAEQAEDAAKAENEPVPVLDPVSMPSPVVPLESLKTNMDGTVNPAMLSKKKKVGPNDPCPCGSGKKYKNCCGKV